MTFNLPVAPEAAARLRRVTTADPVEVVETLAESHHGATTLSALGVPRHALRSVAERIVESPYPNPRPVDVDELLSLLEAAW
jgi:alcohol dehydrogenase class IV